MATFVIRVPTSVTIKSFPGGAIEGWGGGKFWFCFTSYY